jgi:MT0933-like antitoxin protein
MGISDRLKDLKTKAIEAAAEHSDQIQDAVEKATTTADERTGGKYHERIEKVGAQADGLVAGLKQPREQADADGVARPDEGSPPSADAASGTASDADTAAP